MRKEVDLAWSGDLGVEHYFFVEVVDDAGGKAYPCAARTRPKVGVVRCKDRQNFFVPYKMNHYVGRIRCAVKGALPQVPGVELAERYCPKPRWMFAGPGFFVHDVLFDSTLVPGGRDPGLAQTPVFNDRPIPEYAAQVRYVTLLGKGRGPCAGREYRVSIRLKQKLETTGAVWPVIATTTKAARYVFNEAAGPRRIGHVPADGHVDLPIGGVAGNVLALSPLRVSGDGKVGLPGPEGTVEAGDTFRGSFALVDAKNVHPWRNALGFDGPTPFRFELSQGKLKSVGWYVLFEAESNGVAGEVKGGEVPDPRLEHLPVKLENANPNWPIGLWTPNRLQPYGFMDGIGLGRLDVTRDSEFYFGSLLTASDPDLCLAFAEEWTRDGARVEVSNPTAQPITAIVRTAAPVSDRLQFAREVTIPAGTNLYVRIGERKSN